MPSVQMKPYPFNLLYRVFNGDENIKYPDDINEAFEVVVSTLSDREREYIHFRYIEGKSKKEIAPIFGFASAQSVRNLENKMILRIRHHSRLKYILNGLSNIGIEK